MRHALTGAGCAAVMLLTACGGGDGDSAAFSTSQNNSSEECIGYGCSPEQDAELNEADAAANDEEAATPTPQTAAVGEVVAFDGGITVGTITVNGLRRVSEPETSYSSAVPTHGSWLVVDVTVQVASRTEPGAALISAYDFTVQDDGGVIYDSDTSVLESTLSAELVPGRQVRGEVAFDAPAGALLLDWSPGFDGPLVTFSING
ncbi:DUF4352 domain-containing protein [Trujillonella endophytica]|uniref:DUF4352 domain-containing protein n=1 Tax=Trujillonella endophytica TaxID=673521 RepID=A0A1H8S9I2_9ACTN|nr:DUF4352 domain-containing protein [Trujillella endophytica]SEO75321.1 protein of unknown function [Trujillella endophytica]